MLPYVENDMGQYHVFLMTVTQNISTDNNVEVQRWLVKSWSLDSIIKQRERMEVIRTPAKQKKTKKNY